MALNAAEITVEEASDESKGDEGLMEALAREWHAQAKAIHRAIPEWPGKGR